MPKRTGLTKKVSEWIEKNRFMSAITSPSIERTFSVNKRSANKAIWYLVKRGTLTPKLDRHPGPGKPQVYRINGRSLKQYRKAVAVEAGRGAVAFQKLDDESTPGSYKPVPSPAADEISAEEFGEKVFRYWQNLKTSNVRLEADVREARAAAAGLQNEIDRLNKELAAAGARAAEANRKAISHGAYTELKKYSERLEAEVDELRKKLDQKKQTFPLSEIANVR